MNFFVVLIIVVVGANIAELDMDCGEYKKDCDLRITTGPAAAEYTEDLSLLCYNCTKDPFVHDYEKGVSKVTYKYICTEMGGCNEDEVSGLLSCFGDPIKCKEWK